MQAMGQPVVLDVGTSQIKAGFGGESEPRVIVTYAKSCRPVDRGTITNWDEIERLWLSIFLDDLDINPCETDFVVTCPVLSTINQREQIISRLFEEFRVRGLLLTNQALMAGYASGSVSGIAVDIGEGLIQIAPLSEGHALTPYMVRVNFGGYDLSHYLNQLLMMSSDLGLSSRSDLDMCRDLKERFSYVALDYDAEVRACTAKPSEFERMLQVNGQDVKIGQERFQCTELLFSPSQRGLDMKPIDELIHETVMNCDIDLRRDLFSNIVLAGGTSLCPGLGPRLQQGVTRLVAPSVRVRVDTPPRRRFAAWFGSALSTTLPTFQTELVTEADFLEDGPEQLAKRFLL